MNKILFNAILSKIQKDILANRNEIENAKEIDSKYFDISVNLKELINIIEHYKNQNIENVDRDLFVFCNGNPDVVINLIMIAVCTNVNMKIDVDNVMLGVNSCIISIVNKVLSENNMGISIHIVKNYVCNDAIFIDRVNDYRILKDKFKNARYIPFQALDVFCNCDKYDDLFDMIYEYALKMNIDIGVFDDEEGIESVFEFGNAETVLLLTEVIDSCINTKNKKVYINENPFKNNELVFSGNMIKRIIKNNVDNF